MNMQPIESITRILDDAINLVGKSGTYSLKYSLHGRTLVLKFMTVVHFGSESSLNPQLESARDQARQLMKDRVKNLKKDYKDATGEALKYEDLGEGDNLEMIHSTSNSLRKVAYYRYNQTLSLDM
jgi:hypothetical protein